MTTTKSIPASDQATRLRRLVEGSLESPSRAATRAKVVTISSGKGGVGKTSLAVNLAIALQARGARTTLLDLDLGLANADLLCGLNPATRLDRAVVQGTSLNDLSVLAPGGFRLIPGSVGLARGDDSSRVPSFLSRLDELEGGADVVILDTGAGMGPMVRSALRAADLPVLVATPEPTSIADAYALLKVTTQTVASGDAQFLPVAVINQCATVGEAQQVHQRISSVARRFLARDLPLLGSLPQDPAVSLAVRDRRPLMLVSPDSPAAAAISRLSEAVIHRVGLADRGGNPPREAGGLNAWQRLARFVVGGPRRAGDEGVLGDAAGV